MNVGDFVVPTPLHQIFCGSGLYDRAVVVCLEPYTIVSEWGDMLWSHEKPEDFVVAGPADKKSRKAALNRFYRDYPKLKPSLLARLTARR